MFLYRLYSVHTDCTPVRTSTYYTGALDWTRVGGVVQKSVEVCKTDVNNWKLKYLPDWDHYQCG